MIPVNKYFDGKVSSLAFENAEGRTTVGVMLPGEYNFGTDTVEYMTIVAGSMTVKLPGETDWHTYHPFETFRVEKGVRFDLKIVEACAYKCIYKDA